MTDKRTLITAAISRFQLIKDGKALYRTQHFAVRFCSSKSNNFSNTVLSLSKLEKYDHIPCFVVVVKANDDNVIYLCNTTFLKKISHSSMHLEVNNIVGSFNGSDIRKEFPEYKGCKVENAPEHFDELFDYHRGFCWAENLERLVESTKGIIPHSTRIVFNRQQEIVVLTAPQRAKLFVESPQYATLLADLSERCEKAKEAIAIATHIDNVNIRGRLVEALITVSDEERIAMMDALKQVEQQLPVYDTRNGLGDYVKAFGNTLTYTDIKTKVMYLDSNPKAYNVDKFLECMAEDKSVFLFFFVGLDENGVKNTLLCSVFQHELLKATLLQEHWSGRGTRGTAQFRGTTIQRLLEQTNFSHDIRVEEAQTFLETLLKR